MLWKVHKLWELSRQFIRNNSCNRFLCYALLPPDWQSVKHPFWNCTDSFSIHLEHNQTLQHTNPTHDRVHRHICCLQESKREMATAAFKGESPFNGILEREHHESDFKWVFERNKKLFEIPGISGTQITSTQRAAPLEWYFSFLTHQCSVSIKIWIVLSVFFLLDFIPYSSLHYRLCPSLKWILHFSIAGKWLHYYITRSRSLCLVSGARGASIWQTS